MSRGKRVGSRRAPKKASSWQPSLLGLAGGVTLSVIAWGYLVYAAVDFGASARGGDSRAWLFLGLASVGAMACLFLGLMLVGRVMNRLGISGSSSHSAPSASASVAPTLPVLPPPPREPVEPPSSSASPRSSSAASSAASPRSSSRSSSPRPTRVSSRPAGGRRAAR